MIITNLDREESRWSIWEGVVERGCARLMKQGGGSLPRELNKCGQKLTQQQKDTIIAMGQAGNHTHAQIAVAAGCASGTVSKLLQKLKIKTNRPGRRTYLPPAA